ncbi:MAG TPA: thiamine phosphate synthase [Rhodocyclaceae bacterium]|nr:thiamine phosphate synthase [Rhodocyclaceae bacterium]
MTNPAALRGLYAVTPDDPLLPRLSVLVSMTLKGGVKVVQYRNKTAPQPLRRSQAAELVRICRAEGAKLIVNDDLALALEIGADGVHLGKEDVPGGDLAAVRAALGPERILGVSCYNELARAEQAVTAGADYIAFGAVFPSPTKPAAAQAPLSLISEAKARFGDRSAIAAIGGITLDNAPEVIAAGADLVAVITDLFDAMDIASRAEAYQTLF